MSEKHHAQYSEFIANLKKDVLISVIESYKALSLDTDNWVANLANVSSLLWHAYHSLKIPVNWAGFYVKNPKNPNQLILGPFQGKVACQVIEIGKGVCGNAASKRATQLVPDVEAYPGHIACDGDTKSEIVVPIIAKDVVVGVLDLDCLASKGFDDDDAELLKELCEELANTNAWNL